MLIEDLLKTLLVYGPLGLFCALALAGYIQKDRTMVKMQKEFLEKQEALSASFLAEQKALMKSHKEEMTQMQDRYVTKAETWMDKYRERSEALENLIQALSLRKQQG